jgi:hypothetical protein
MVAFNIGRRPLRTRTVGLPVLAFFTLVMTVPVFLWPSSSSLQRATSLLFLTESSTTTHTETRELRSSQVRIIDTTENTNALRQTRRSATVELPSVLLAVPGHGNAERTPLLKASLEALHQSTASQNIPLHCIVYVWRMELVQSVTQELRDLCTVEYSEGLWTHHLIKVGQFIDHYSKDTTTRAAFTHVAIMMDDMNTQTIDLPALLQSMQRAQLDVVSPAIPHWSNPSNFARSHCLAHVTGHVDILFTVFTTTMYRCYQNQIDTAINEYGWGYDITLADVCRAAVGVIDHELAHHQPTCSNPDPAAGCELRTYDANVAAAQMWEWIRISMAFPTATEANTYKNYVAVERPSTLPYCRLVAFHLVPRLTDVTSTRPPLPDEWTLVLQQLYTAGYLSLEASPLATVALVDSLEQWFPGRHSVLHEPWIAFVQSKEALDTVLESPEFQQSAYTCLALLVFSADMAARISDELDEMEIWNVPVCIVHRPKREEKSSFTVEDLGQQMIKCATSAMNWPHPTLTS